MPLEQHDYSQVVTFAPQVAGWTATIAGGGQAGSWAGTYQGYSYVAVGQSLTTTIQAGDRFQLYSSGVLKEPTLFTVAAIGVPGFGLVNVFFVPQPQSSPNNGDVVTSVPRPKSPKYLGAIGHVKNLVRSYSTPGGPESLSLLLMLPPEYRTDALNPGRIVQVFRGASCIWEGKLDEPQPGPDGWTVTAHGAGTYGTDFAAIWSTWNADDPVNRAITRGLRWNNPGIGSPTGIFLSQQQDSGSETVTAHLNLLITGGGLLWKVEQPVGSGLPGSPWVLNVYPFTQQSNGNPTQPPDRLLICNSPVARTIAADINTLVIRYQITADAAATSTKKATVATFGVRIVQNQPSITLHGPMEYYLDVTSAGVLTTSQVDAIGNNILNRYIRASFAGPFTAGPGQVRNASGQPVDAACDRAGLVYQVMVTDGSYGGEVATAPLTFLSGAYSYDENSHTATITPFQSARTDMASLISTLYPVKFLSSRLCYGVIMRAKEWSPGDQFGRLTVIGPESRLGVRNHRAVLCRCNCGTEKMIALDKLRSGHTSSCGCLRAEIARESAQRAQQAKKGKRYDFKPVTELGISGLHDRLKRDRGLASEHECSYADGSCKGPMHWANISHKYKDIADFMPLCQSHHWRYDHLVRNLKRPWG